MSVVADPIEDPRRALRAARLNEFRVFVRRFFRNPLGVVGFVIVVLLVLVAIFAPLIATHDPYLPSLGKRLSAPSAEFWFGADELGRDIYSRLVYGSRLTLFIVGLVIVTSAPIGLVIGAVSGTVGGWTDRIFMRITDVFLAVPKLLLALAFDFLDEPGPWKRSLELLSREVLPRIAHLKP